MRTAKMVSFDSAFTPAPFEYRLVNQERLQHSARPKTWRQSIAALFPSVFISVHPWLICLFILWFWLLALPDDSRCAAAIVPEVSIVADSPPGPAATHGLGKLI